MEAGGVSDEETAAIRRLRAEHAAMLIDRNAGPWHPPVVHLRARAKTDDPDPVCGIGGGAVVSTTDPDTATCVACLQFLVNEQRHEAGRERDDIATAKRDADEWRKRADGLARSVIALDPSCLRTQRKRAFRDLGAGIARARTMAVRTAAAVRLHRPADE